MPLDEFELLSSEQQLQNHSSVPLNTVHLGENDALDTAGIDAVTKFNTESVYNPQYAAVQTNINERPGFLATGIHSLFESNSVSQTFYGLAEIPAHLNAYFEHVEDNWTPFTMEALDDIQPKYQDYVLDAVSPNEQDARRRFIKNKQYDEEYYAEGSVLANLAGGLAGFVGSPERLMFPVSAAMKYAKFTQNMTKNLASVGVPLVEQTTAHNAWVQSVKVGGNFQDFAVDSIKDATAALALTGLAVGWAGIVTGGQLQAAKDALKFGYEGVTAKFVVNEHGHVTGLIAAELEATESINPSKPKYFSKEGINNRTKEFEQWLKDKNIEIQKLSLEPEFISKKTKRLEEPSIEKDEDAIKNNIVRAQAYLDNRMASEGLFNLVPGMGKIAGVISPAVRMMTSRFPTMNNLAVQMFDNDIVTLGMINGKPKPLSFASKIDITRRRAIQFGWELEGMRKQANGLEASLVGEETQNGLKKTIQGGKTFSREGFGAAVANVMRSGEQHSNKAVNNAATRVTEHLLETFKPYLKAHGLSEEVFTPRTAYNYLMRNYNRHNVRNMKSEWIDMVVKAYRKQDAIIADLNRPIDEISAHITRLEEAIFNNIKIQGEGIGNQTLATRKAHNEEVLRQRNELLAARKEHQRLSDELAETIQNKPDYHDLLEDRNFLTSEERKESQNIQRPVKEQEQTVQDLKDEFQRLKALQRSLYERTLTAKTEKSRAANKTKHDRLQSEIDNASDEVGAAIQKLDELKVDLQSKMDSGEINPRLLTKFKFKNVFRDAYSMPKLRKVFESDEARALSAEGTREKILNMSDEQLTQQFLADSFEAKTESSLLNRDFMIGDVDLQNNNFLSNDLTRNIMTYDMSLGKKTVFREKFGLDGMEKILKDLNNDRRLEESAIDKMPKDQQESARNQLEKDFKAAKEDAHDTYVYSMGIGKRSLRARAFIKGMRDFTYSTRLGALPIPMLTDFGSIFMKNSFLDVIHYGILPFAKTINGLVKTPEGKNYRESALHIGLACEHMRDSLADNAWNSVTQSNESWAGILSNGLTSIAHLSGNLSGANFLQNVFEHINANVIQGRVIRSMQDFEKGALSEYDRMFLLRHGIDPQVWSKRFLKEYGQHGEDNFSGYWNWTDGEAKMKMAYSIQQGVRDATLRPGIGDVPFAANDPVWGMLFFLKKWAFAAFTRYTVPMMQRPDANKAMGMGMMLMLGSLVDPLRKWSKGESYDFENKEKFLLDGFINSGVAGILTDFMQDANVLMGSPFLNKIKSDRYMERTTAGILGGPLAGVADDVFRVLGMFVEGSINENEVKKFIRLIPLTQIWYLRKLSNSLVEHANLPKTRHRARQVANLLKSEVKEQ